MMRTSTLYGNETGPQRAGLIFALLLHGVVIAAIFSHPPTRAAIATAVPIMVSLIPSPPVAQPQTPPQPVPVRPHLAQKPSQPIAPLPLVSAPAEAPAPFVAPTPPARDLPPIDAASRQSVATAPAEGAPPVILPRFDAAYLQNPPPVYPALARRLGEQGRVLLRVLVTTTGLADRVEVKTSSGAQRLDQAALDAVKRWRFVPARQGDQAVSAWVVVPIAFSLEG
jgi:periplasmic protein TonB